MTWATIWTILSGFFCASTVCTSVLYLRAVSRVAKRAALAPEWLQKRVASQESSIQLLTSSLDEQRELLTALANKVKMQRVRNVVAHNAGSPDEPNPYTNPDEWRSMMNKRLAQARVNRGGI
jgi:uncharacterized coiled-coil protein SlyX